MNFEEAENRFQELERKWSAGQINAQSYRASLANLRVTDPAGDIWMLQEHSGRWFVHRSGQWIESQRPHTASRGETPASQPAQVRQAAQRAAYSQPVQAGPAARRGRNTAGMFIIYSLLGICLGCGVLGLIGGYLVYSGRLALPAQVADRFGQTQDAPETAAPPQIKDIVKSTESLAVPADGAPHADSNGVSLAVPADAFAEGGQVDLRANSVDAPWRKSIEQAVSIDTPFYSVVAQGKNDTPGSLSLSFPAANPGARLLAVIDNEYLVELAQVPQDGKLTLQTRAGPSDASEFKQPDGYDGAGSIYYAVITPKSASRPPSEIQMVSLRQDVDDRNCIPDISIIGGAAVNLCRQNEAGTVQVMFPTAKRDLVPQVDIMVDKIEAVMKMYYNLGFTTAQLSHSAPMLVRVSAKVTSPSYYPLNGVLYIPVDTVTRIAALSPTDVYHEMAHWIQAVKYSTRLAYWSGEKTWWLETSAENMVMLVEPGYVGSNLTTYGTISNGDNSLAFQSEPYQWPGDYYVHAQLVKVNMCDSAACPLSAASFAKAISEGSYPLMNGASKGLISGNMKDYAYYLLGKSPVSANSAIPLSGPVKTGEGYGEYIRVTRNNDTDIKFDYNGADPQMRKDSQDGKDALAVEATLKRDGVYPLMVQGGQGKNPGLPVELIIEPGAPFYYTIDDGPFKYSDGGKEVKILPIHGEMGIKKVRLVAVGESGGEVFKARVQPLELEGAWQVMIAGAKTGGAMSCSGESGSVDNPDGTAQLMGYILTIVGVTGDMQTDPTGRSLDWNQVASRVPASFQEANVTYDATALLAGDTVKFQAKVDIPKASESSQLPPAVPLGAAAAALPLLWFGRKRLNIRAVRVMTNVLMIAFLLLVTTGCFGIGMYGDATLDANFKKIEYVGSEETGVMTVSEDMSGATGKPLWKLTGTGTYNVTFDIETTVTDADGKETTEVTVCTGQVTYPIVANIYKDFRLVIPED